MRERILTFIKERDRAYVHEVARHFRIGHEGARKQLVRMEEDGWVIRNPVGDKVGRPRDSYSVTLAGDRLLPKAYDKLSIEILSALGRGAENPRRLLAEIAERQVAAWKPRLEGKSSGQKLELLKEIYAPGDRFVSVESREGNALLIERNCPFLNVALEHPALCSLTVNTLEGLLGHPVRRQERFQDGHGRCVFKVLLGERIRDARFSLESERP
jgi:predicted ArsR family transcriptional regulator